MFQNSTANNLTPTVGNTKKLSTMNFPFSEELLKKANSSENTLGMY